MQHLEERLQQLKAQQASLQLQLDELAYLIVGYENTIKAQEEEPKEDK
jgi:prefoldin subunit 5